MEFVFLRTINCIENLSNEIFYEIFDYLDGYDIYQAFSKLNIRLENLLINCSFFLKLKLSSETIFDGRYEQFLKSSKHRIISIDFESRSIVDTFTTLCTIDSSFNHLQSIILKEIFSFKLFVLLFYLKSLPDLSSLSICLMDCHGNPGDIYQMILCLPLKYFRLSILGYDQLDFHLPVPMTSDQYSSIEYLIIHHPCTLSTLADILSYTPRLSHLYCYDVIEGDDHIKSNIKMELTNLVHLSMIIYNLYFDEFQGFIRKFCSQLQFFKIQICCLDKSFLDSNRWEQMIVQHMTHLKRFLFIYHDSINENFEISPYHLLINHFTSSFWINRQWIFQLLVRKDELIYIIHPYE
jgi:hypothetical protein